MITHLLKNSRASGIGPENATRPSAKRKTLECKNINSMLIVLSHRGWVILYWVHPEIKFKY